jgi:hypothetical protein
MLKKSCSDLEMARGIIRSLKSVRTIKPVINLVYPPKSNCKFVRGKTLAEYSPKLSELKQTNKVKHVLAK